MPYWILFALLSAIFAALVAVFGKIGVSKVDTTLSTTVRAIIMAVFLIGTSFFLGKGKFLGDIDKNAFTFILLSGVAGALSWIFYFTALKLGPASGVAALDRLSVVFVFIFSLLFLSEKFSPLSALGVLLIFLGAIFMVIR